MTTEWTESMDGTLPVVKFRADSFETEGIAQETDDDVLGEELPEGYGGAIIFQHGPIREVGVNGTTVETVIAALVARLEGFQRGLFANKYNQDAIDQLNGAKASLESRTRDRQKRAVEGTNQA